MLFSVQTPPNISDGSLSIEVIGDPSLLSRHSYDRTNQGRWFISDTPGLREFRDAVQSALQSVNSQLPVFGDDVCLELSITFHMARPFDELDEGHHLKLTTMNEFCLDALRGIAFEDKNCIVSLHSGKVHDCMGKTVLAFRTRTV